jgi:hypothetical protein
VVAEPIHFIGVNLPVGAPSTTPLSDCS